MGGYIFTFSYGVLGMRGKFLFVSVVLASVAADSALAADMPVKAPVLTQPSVFNWTGCYIGAHFGGSGGRKQLSNSSGLEADDISSISADTGGFLPGGQAGCNYQFFGNWVLGAEGALSWFTMHGVTEIELPNNVGTANFSARADWLASATGRLGYAWNPWIVYLKGGVAWVHDKYDVSGTVNVTPFDFAPSDTRTGWTLGLGFGFVFWGNWSAELEYNHYDFGTKGVTLFDPLNNVLATANVTQRIDAVTFGLNYHFPTASWQPASKSSDDDKTDKVERVAINGGITYTKPYSLYGDLGILFAPGGLDNSGFRVRLGTIDGRFSFLQDITKIRVYGNGEEGSVQFGYQFVQGSTSLLLVTGADYITGSSSPPPTPSGINSQALNSANPVPGSAFGLKTLAELYSNPTDKTMVRAEGNYSTAFRNYYVEFEAGYAALGPEIYVGPKAIFLGDQNFDQWRLGGFISGFKVGNVELGVSGGYLKDRAQGSGFFVGTDFYVRY